MIRRTLILCALVASVMPATPAYAHHPAALDDRAADPVVVATFDTGTNPWHPCFSRPGQAHPRDVINTYPANSKAIPLSFRPTYQQSKAASASALAGIEPFTLHHVPDTNLSFYGGVSAATNFVDDYPHGAQASSQIGCSAYGMAPNAQLVILNWYDDPSEQVKLTDWVAAQPWIDVVHFNIQDIPYPLYRPVTRSIEAVIAAGKMVVIAGGNGVAGYGASYPMELSSYNGPPGSLIAGANDNDGWTVFSNLDPHVVSDGLGTVAAAPTGFGSTGFSGTSSASPRITGYVARIIGQLRAAFGHTGNGLVTIPNGAPRPTVGPLSDGVLKASELHEIVRRTANPNPHASRYDGTRDLFYGVPQPAELPFAFYPKMGFGEVSEHTMPDAFDVASGARPMPERPVEDEFYAASEQLRRTFWG